MEKKRPGRPPGDKYPVKKQLRLGEGDAALLERLAEKRRESEAAVMRQAIRLLAEREGLD